MARRDAEAGGLSLDSLMDTLTNVVGILVIILIFTVIQGADAVKRIKGFVDEISEDQLRRLAAQSREVQSLLEKYRLDLKELSDDAPNQQTAMARYKEMIAELNKNLAELARGKVDITEIQKQVDQRRTQVEGIEKDIDAKEKEIASLKAQLAQTQAAGPNSEVKIVNLPEPRQAPKGAKPITFICRGGRVMPLDTPGLQEKAKDAVQAASRVLIRQGQIDCGKLTEIFDKRGLGDRYLTLKVRIGTDAKPYLAVLPRPDAGDKTEAISMRNSQFSRSIQGVDAERFYLDFRVFSDSFPAYLEARNVAARQGLLAGWTPYALTSEYRISFPTDMQMTCVGKTPPQPQPAQPGAVTRPPPPVDQVD